MVGTVSWWWAEWGHCSGTRMPVETHTHTHTKTVPNQAVRNEIFITGWPYEPRPLLTARSSSSELKRLSRSLMDTTRSVSWIRLVEAMRLWAAARWASAQTYLLLMLQDFGCLRIQRKRKILIWAVNVCANWLHGLVSIYFPSIQEGDSIFNYWNAGGMTNLLYEISTSNNTEWM